jgi:hypothetical protein
VSFEDPWETRPGDVPVAEPGDVPVADLEVRRQSGRHAKRGPKADLARFNALFPRQRRFRVASIVIAATALIIVAIGSWVADSRSARALSEVTAAAPAAAAPTTATAQAQSQVPSQVTGGEGQGMSGQIFGIGDRCLAGGNGETSSGTPAVLATCTGTEDKQEWTVLANGEIVLNGRCLGVNPAGAKPMSMVGLFACTGATSQIWSAQEHHLRSMSSGLCLASWKSEDASGIPVGITACQSTAKAQMWTVPSKAVDPSGLALPVGNIPGWHQDFTDNFTENVPVGDFPAAVSSTWGDYLDGWPDTTHHGTYEPTKVVSIHDGTMNMFLHTVNGVHMVAAPYPILPGATGSGGGTTYGMYEVRFKAQQVTGYKTAWLLWPDSESEDQGEIDFPEGYLQDSILAFMHHVGSDPQKQQDEYRTDATYAEWHTATTIWTANSVIFMLDGKVIGDSTDKAVIPHTPMHWVLQTETRTSGGPPSDTATANVEIDWVSVWLRDKS